MNRVIFIKSAGVILLLTAWAKLLAFNSGTFIAEVHDPILGLAFQDEFLVVGLVELAVAAVCLLTNRVRFQLSLLAWLGTSFAVYRLGLALIGIKLPCPCFGDLARIFHLSTASANALALVILVYILAGAYYGLFCRQAQKPEQLAA